MPLVFDDEQSPAPSPASGGGRLVFDDEAPKVNKSRSAADIARDVGVTALKGAVGLPAAFVGLADIPTGGRVGKALEGAGIKFKETQDILSGQYSEQQQAANKKVQEADGFVDTTVTALQNPSTIATAIGESIPQMLGGAGIARMGIKAADKMGRKVAPWLAGAIGEGTMAAGSAAEGMRQESEDGLLSGKQTVAALGTGAGTAVLGAAGGKLAQKFGFGDVDTILAKGGPDALAAGAAKKGFMRQVVEGGISEGVFEEMPQSIQETMWQNWANDKPLMEGTGNAAAMGMLAGMGMGMGGGGYNAAMSREVPAPVTPQVQPTQATPPVQPTTATPEQPTQQAPSPTPPAAPIVPPQPDPADALDAADLVDEARAPEEIIAEAEYLQARQAELTPENGYGEIFDAERQDIADRLEGLQQEIQKPAAPSWTAAAQPTTMQAPSMDKPVNVVQVNHFGTPVVMGRPVSTIPSATIAQRRDEAATPEERQAIEQEMQRRGLPGATDGATDQGGQVSPVAAQGVEGASADVPGSGSDSQAGVPGGMAGGSAGAGVPGSANGSIGPAGPASAPSVDFDVTGRTDEQLANLVKAGKPGWREAAIAEVARRKPATTGEQIAPQPEPLAQTQGQAQGAEGKTVEVTPPADAKSDQPSAETLADLGLYREYGDKHQYRMASKDGTVSGGWFTSNSKDGAIEMATKAHDNMPPDARLTREQRDAKADAEYDAESERRYGKLTTDELRAEVDRLNGEIASLQKAGKREFNGNGGRRTGAAVSNEGARGAGEEKMRLERLIKQREATEVSTFDQRFPNIAAAEKVIKDRKLKQVAVFKDGDQYRIGAKGASNKAAAKNLIARIKQLGGINTRYRSDVIGDKSGAPGLFSNNGKGLDDLATELKADGFDIDTDTVDGGVEILTDLIQRANMGETILNFEGQQEAAEKRANDEYRDNLKEEIEKLGGNPAKNASTKKLVDMLEGLRERLRADIEQKSIEQAAQLEAIIGKNMTDAEWDMLLDERNAEVFDYTQDIAAVAQLEQEREALNAAEYDYERSYSQATGNRPEKGPGENDPARGGESQTAPTEAGRGAEREAFDLTGETPEEVKAKEEAQAAKVKAEKEAADKAEAEAKKKRIDADIASRQKASAENFVLGQDAEDAIAGQGDIFSQPALKKPFASTNTVFTEDAATAARERLKAKLGRMNAGLDPETMLDGITLAGYHIEKGARTFAAYAKAMIGDLGDAVKPYLKSWYAAVSMDPRANGKSAGIPVAQVQAIADRVSAANKNMPKVNVFASPNSDGVPGALRKFIADQKAANDVEGALHDGEIYLFASGLADEARAEQVLAEHEVTHYGLRGILGDDLKGTLQYIWANNNTVRKAATELAKKNGISTIEATEEVLADMPAKDLVGVKGWRRLVLKVRDWLGAHGFKALSDRLTEFLNGTMDAQAQADLIVADLVRRAREFVRNGPPMSGGMMGDAMLSRSAMESLSANMDRGLRAMQKAISEKATVSRAMYRDGLGWVDFVWGDEGKVKPSGKTKGGLGISHILEARMRKDGLTREQAESLAFEMVRVIAAGIETKRDTVGSVVRIGYEHDGKIVWLTGRSGGNAFAVTGYEIEPDAQPAGRATALPTQTAASRTRDGMGAGPVASGATVPSLDQATRRDTQISSGSPAGAESDSSITKLSRQGGKISGMTEDRGPGADLTNQPTKPGSEADTKELRKEAMKLRAQAHGMEHGWRETYGKDDGGYRTHLYPKNELEKQRSLYEKANELEKNAELIESDLYKNDPLRVERWNKFIFEVTNLLSKGIYDYYGIRVNSKNPITGKTPKIKVGGKTKKSYYQPDGVTTSHSHGTSAIRVTSSGLDAALKDVSVYHRNGLDILLIGSNSANEGNDPGEIEMQDATILAIYVDKNPNASFSRSGQSSGRTMLSRASQSQLPGVQQSPPVQPPSQQAMPLQSGAAGNQSVFNTPEPSKIDDIIFKLQDKHIDLKRAIHGITDAGRQIADKWNTYMQEELFHGRSAKRVKDFTDRELAPMLREMALRKVSIADLDKYLWARHAKEANALIEQRDPGVMVDDVTGQPKGSGMTDQEADDYFAGLSQDQRNQLDAIAKKVDDILTKTRDLYVSYGLENRDTVQGWADSFQHYVPLMREDHDGGMGIGQGFSIKGREAKHRTGSTRAVADVLANIAAQRERAIVRGEKNRVAVSLAGLVKLNPAPDFWTLDKIPQERVLNEKTGQVETREVPNYRSRDNVIIAKIKDSNGNVKERAIVLNENDERAVRLAKSMKNIDIPMLEGWLGAAAVVTRYFSAINTQYNPVFGVINLIRDVGAGALNLSSTALKGKEAIVTNPKRIAAMYAAIYAQQRTERAQDKAKWIKGALDMAGADRAGLTQLFEDFTEQGGQTGFRDMFKNSNDRADAMQMVMDPTSWTESKWGKFFKADGKLKVPLLTVQKGATPVFQWLSDYNLAMENAVRLSAYKEALDSGMSKPQAASLAKNLTVNFNRKGSWGAQAGALYAFFNAATQGTARIGETLTRRDHVTGKYSVSGIGKKIIGGGVMLGVMQAVALAMAGFDDDEPPEFIRERNIVIPLMNGKYVSIPMPLGFHVIPNIGRIATETLMGRRGSVVDGVIDLMGITFEAFNPIGSAGWSMQTVAPTILDPMAAIIENKDWTGKPIAKEKFSNTDPTPGFDMAKDNASTIATGIAYAINLATGGSEFTSGKISPTPDQLDYLWGQVTGGVGREFNKLYQTVESQFTGEELPPHKIPLAGRLYGDTQAKSSINSKFYQNVIDMKRHKAEYMGRKEKGDSEGAAEYLADNPDAKLFRAVGAYESKVQQLRSAKRKAVEQGISPERVKMIEQRTTELMTRFNEQVKSAQ